MKQEFSLFFCYLHGFVAWICRLDLSRLKLSASCAGVMHEADDAYSIRSTWSCYWLDQFFTLALNTLILSIFYISLDWSTILVGIELPLCVVVTLSQNAVSFFWSQVEYKIVCFISCFMSQ